MELPEGWVEVKLGEVTEIISGKNQKNVINPNGKYPIYGSGGIIGYSDQYLCEAGSTIIGRKGTINSPIFVKEQFWNVDTAFGFSPLSGLNPQFLFAFCQQFNFKKLDKSTTIPSLAKTDLLQIEIPLPPLPEQHRIVAKIEALFTSLDQGIASLKTAQQQLRIYRQAVLKWAFEGKLTEVWRTQQKTLPDGKEILTLLKSEKKEVCQNKGIKLKDTQPISSEELSELPELPIQMVWARLNDLIWSVKDGPHYSPSYQESGILFISGGNIKQDGIDFKKAKYISVELHEELSKRCKPEKGDILYTKGGTTGIARVNTYDFEFNVWVHVAVLKHLPSINPFYLQHVLNSQHCYNQSQKYTHGVGNQDLGLTRMILITLPICSLEEQNQIVAAIETRLSVCDKLEETILKSLQQAEALRQSILKKAFIGKLVPQDPADEPAAVLLERIRAEREQTAPKSIKTKRGQA